MRIARSSPALPLLANLYLNKLDRIREALRRIGLLMERLGLKLHPKKTRMVDLRRGKESFVFLGLHDSKEAEHTAEPADVLCATVAVAQGNEAHSGTRT